MKKILITLLLFTAFTLNAQDYKQQLLNSQYIENYIEIKMANKADIEPLIAKYSVDEVKYNPEQNLYKAKIFLHQKDYQNFINENIPFQLLEIQDREVNVNMATTLGTFLSSWTLYPTYSVYEQLLDYFQSTFPERCKVDTILSQTPNSHKILAVHISNSLNTPQAKPRFFYSSTMHGDETCGYFLMLQLINYLLTHPTDTKVSQILEEIDLWICPLENPDGTYRVNNNDLGVNYSTRASYNGTDLNRHYPDAFADLGINYEPEIMAMLNFMGQKHFTMSANLHGGAELFNYIWDLYTSSNPNHQHPDQLWWNQTGRKFADTCHLYNANYFKGEDNGVTEGGDWYVITGSRQDCNNYHLRCREVTLETCNNKTPQNAQLNNLWNYIRRSLINYILEVKSGFNGIVTDSVTGIPLKAHVFINNYDKESEKSDLYTALPFGDYYRPIGAGNYSVTYSADSYISQTHILTVNADVAVRKDVQLVKIGTSISDYEHAVTIFPNPVENVMTLKLSDPTLLNADLMIYDVNGKMLYQKAIYEENTVINLSTFASGFYFMSLSKEGKTLISKKIIH
ncbi:MAG: T9SS type A sorting domain-containing protein [Bacteroidales bacterium]|jgi:hypothetical protein|nr:T9SS type A sorting domain-containing protein [Bacteroidales bacterium]